MRAGSRHSGPYRRAFPRGDWKSLSAILSRLASHQDDLAAMGNAARQQMEDYSITRAVEEL